MYDQIKLRAAHRNTSAAEELRALVSEGLAQQSKQPRKQGLHRLARMGVQGGPKDLAANIDKYLYE